jgi:hypothetical protein
MRSWCGVTRADLCLTKVFGHCIICDGFLAECGYEIIVDDSGHPALPVEIEDD